MNSIAIHGHIIFEQFDDTLWTDRICGQCGQNHGYRPNFEGVKTIMDIIPELIGFIEGQQQLSENKISCLKVVGLCPARKGDGLKRKDLSRNDKPQSGGDQPKQIEVDSPMLEVYTFTPIFERSAI